MSDEAVRCLLFPERGPGREVVLAVTDGKVAVPEELGADTTHLLLPDGVMIVSGVVGATALVNRRVAGQAVKGPFLIMKCDSKCDPVSLNDKEMAFYIAAAMSDDDTTTPADLGMEREIEIADVIVTYRRVKIPVRHGCGADLTRNEAITIWSFTDEGFYGRLPRYAGDETDSFAQRGALVSERGLTPKGGDTCLDNVGVVCVFCGGVLAEGKVDTVEVG